MIDITKPLELSDGTPVELRETNPYWIMVDGEFGDYDHCFFEPNGTAHSAWKPEANGRTLRNVKESEVRTTEEQLQRMEALVRRMAQHYVVTSDGKAFGDEAREIVAELDLSGDERIARSMVANDPSVGRTSNQKEAILSGKGGQDKVALAIACIAKGRELERLKIIGELSRTNRLDALDFVAGRKA